MLIWFFSEYFRSSNQFSCSCADSQLLYPPADHVVTGNLACIPDKGLRSLFKKGPKYRLPSRIGFTKCRRIVEESLQTYCKRYCKKEGVFAPADKAANNVIVIWKRCYVDVLKGELNSTSLLNLRKTNFFCIISILSLNQKSNVIKLTCLHLICPRNYTKILINHASYQFLFTALLPSYISILLNSTRTHITAALTSVKDHVKLPLEIVLWKLFGPSKTLLRISKSCGYEIFRVLKYLLSICLLYTHPCHIIL